MSGGKYVDSEVGLGEGAPALKCLLLLSPTPNARAAFLAPALSPPSQHSPRAGTAEEWTWVGS